MPKTPYRIKRAEHPAEIEGAVRANALSWRESYAGLLADEVIVHRNREDVMARRTMEWALASQEGSWFWVLMDSRDGRVAGMAVALPARDEDAPEILELVSLYILDEAKGTGAGAALMEMAIGDMDCYLWVLEGNERAIAFYRKHGFELDGARRRNDQLHADELRMVRRGGQ